MLKWTVAFVDRLCVVFGAFVCIQIPLFIEQYKQQLVGRQAELSLQVDSMRQAAKLSGKTLEQYIQKFTTHVDLDFINQGDLMQGIVNRWHQLSDALYALQHTSTVMKPFVFVSHFNSDIAKSTFQHYSIGLPLTIEGAAYALVGVVFGYVVFYLARCLCRYLFKPTQKKGTIAT
jgi:hypothetical protein